MAVRFPHVVVWDSSKEHHLTIGVSKPQDRVYVACSDCLDAWEFPVALLDAYKRELEQSNSYQVVQWVEYDD